MFTKNLRWPLAIMATIFAIQVFGHGMSEAEKQTIIEGGNLGYVWIGATHMLTGYDHLAFVFGIIFLLTRFRDIIKYITAFTLGHSVTLIYATFNSIQVNYYLIDAVIALSVCYIAFVNLEGFKNQLDINPPNLLAMIALFGLIHGLGLSTRLQQLPLSEDQLLMNIISFNVGIEVGQISALAVMLVLIAVVRKSRAFPTFSHAFNKVLILAGGLLFLMQVHGYDHAVNGDELVTGLEPAGNTDESAQQRDWQDTITIVIPARGDKEYKFRLVQGATIEFDWRTDQEELFFDFHGEVEGDKTGAYESFQRGTANRSSGALSASFDGTHGWYWKNNSSSPTTITLNAKGAYQRIDTLIDGPGAQVKQTDQTRTHESID